MTRIRVPIIGGNNKSVLIDTTATKGSTLGVDLLMSDGTLVTPAKLAAYLGVTPNPPNKSPNTSTLSVLWSRIIGIPTDLFNRIPGQDGMDGEDGRPGTDGKQGAAGATIQGPPGDDGFDGDPGPPGQTGAAGPTGAASTVPGPAGYPIPGEDGMDGDHGPPGERGPVGVTGISNMPGPQGVPGDDGLDGDHGPPGERGLTGPVSAILGPPGPPGEDGMDGSDGIPGVAIAGAAPTALLGLAAILGISPNFMRSDAAPALDVNIAPVWGGGHQFNANCFFGGDGTGYVVAPNYGFKKAGVINIGIRDTADSTEMLLRCDSSGGIFGMVTSSQLAIRTGNTNRIVIAADGVVRINGAAITDIAGVPGPPGDDGMDGDVGPQGPPGVAPLYRSYTPDSVTVPTGYFMQAANRQQWTGTQRLRLIGTARLRIS